ncbi:MAG: [Clostridia bacterium]|nr:[FeFe] hydrogenase H-cluster radical SAM maturase HydE [Clostridia bacterium]
MNEVTKKLIDKLYNTSSLEEAEYLHLINNRTPEVTEYLRSLAVEVRKKHYGNKVYIRGLIEISNYCKNDCLYCGIRRSNKLVERYRLTEEEIISCAHVGYSLGFRTFVMQGGEDPYYTDERMCGIISEIKRNYPDCAVTLSLGERSRESYERLYSAGADRYLLRHETADSCHYSRLHPSELTLENRIDCLNSLKKIGFQTGCGFMVGSPYQTPENIAKDLKFVETFSPQMCGIGPFIPHKDTPFRDFDAGDAEFTCYLLSIVRLAVPTVLLPATTALGSILEGGRELGILSGANVVMPNLSPEDTRKKYSLYNNKLSTGAESAEKLTLLKEKIAAIGYEVVTDRGDAIKM